MAWHTTYIGIGSNLGDPMAQFRHAKKMLFESGELVSPFASSLYMTQPVGSQNQADFLNAVVRFETSLPPLDLLDYLQQIEQRAGRVRCGAQWGPRTLDLDILLYGRLSVSLPRLMLPHPQICGRAFVLVPLAEIAPELEIPQCGRVADCKQQVAHQGIRRLEESW